MKTTKLSPSDQAHRHAAFGHDAAREHKERNRKQAKSSVPSESQHHASSEYDHKRRSTRPIRARTPPAPERHKMRMIESSPEHPCAIRVRWQTSRYMTDVLSGLRADALDQEEKREQPAAGNRHVNERKDNHRKFGHALKLRSHAQRIP